METNGKFCPQCKRLNRADAIICEHCGKPFDGVPDLYSTTSEMEGKTKYFPDELKVKKERVSRAAPAEGIAIYTNDLSYPIEVCRVNEFIIGRLTGVTDEKVLDLTPYNGYDQGVSRRHLMIRRDGKGYTATDLESSNGTWVNEQRLHPHHPFPLKTGSQIHLGQMQIFVFFQE